MKKQKIVYLTIDDAPSKDFKRKVNYLFSKNIPTIFFCCGELMKKRPKAVIYAIRRGFIIGSHSYDHPHFSKISINKAKDQIKRTDKILDILYKKANVKRPIRLFRFPYLEKGGKNKTAIQNFLKKLGYKQPKFENITYKWYKKEGLSKDTDVYCTYDCMEWTTFEERPLYGIGSLKEVLERMDEDVPEGRRGLNYLGSNEIILLHDFPETARMFIPIIEKFIKKGLKFKLPQSKRS